MCPSPRTSARPPAASLRAGERHPVGAARHAASERDEELMAQAAQLAGRARRRTPPNPWVGCARGAPTATSWARVPPSRPGARTPRSSPCRGSRRPARGATLYTTLEPCSHHGRTGPCADAADRRRRGPRRDCGRGSRSAGRRGRGRPPPRCRRHRRRRDRRRLRSRDQLAPYLHHRRTGRAFCLAKAATSIDGRTAAADGSSQWITGPAARADAHGLRADSQAVVVGAGTALADRPTPDRAATSSRPSSTRRCGSCSTPAAASPPPARCSTPTLAPTLVITTDAAPAADGRRLARGRREGRDRGRGADGRVSTSRARSTVLGGHGVLQAMVEGGPTVHGALARGRARRPPRRLRRCRRCSDPSGAPAFAGPVPRRSRTRTVSPCIDVTALGDDVRLDYDPRSVHEGGA